MADGYVHVIARIRLLSSAEGGRTASIPGGSSYRPNHNFFGPDNRSMAMGFIDLPEGRKLDPGESIEVPIALSYWPDLDGQIYPGREWRIQEGAKLVGIGTVIKVLSEF